MKIAKLCQMLNRYRLTSICRLSYSVRVKKAQRCHSDISALIVQDRKSCRKELIPDLISKWGFLYDCASCHRDAIKFLKKRVYDFILFDSCGSINIKPILKQVEDIECEQSLDPIPTFAFTKDVTKKTKRAYERMGVNDCIARSFDPRDLRLFLYYWLGNIWKIDQIGNRKHS